MLTIGTLLTAVALLWRWLSRPRWARWAERLGQERIALVMGGGILLNLLLVVAIPHAASLGGVPGPVVPALLR
jgi:hypothetical protein